MSWVGDQLVSLLWLFRQVNDLSHVNGGEQKKADSCQRSEGGFLNEGRGQVGRRVTHGFVT